MILFFLRTRIPRKQARAKQYSTKTKGNFDTLGTINKEPAVHSSPGSISAQDIPDALSRLTSALAAQEAIEQNNSQAMEEDEEQEEQTVSLGRRAFPLIELLKSAIKEECEVMWDSQ